jgi:hypothetical protein
MRIHWLLVTEPGVGAVFPGRKSHVSSSRRHCVGGGGGGPFGDHGGKHTS